MDAIEVWLGAHRQLVLFGSLAVAIVSAGIWLWARAHRRQGQQIASHGGVIVGRDNHGTINTGHIGNAAPTQGSDWLSQLSAWVGVLSLIVAVLAWRLPVQP